LIARCWIKMTQNHNHFILSKLQSYTEKGIDKVLCLISTVLQTILYLELSKEGEGGLHAEVEEDKLDLSFEGGEGGVELGSGGRSVDGKGDSVKVLMNDLLCPIRVNSI
jgi:hypothetical protein